MMQLEPEKSSLRRAKISLFILMFSLSLSAQTVWRPGTYHDITPGKSRKAAVLKALGRPSETRKPSLTAFAAETCCEELVYKGKAENGGDLSIALQKGGPVVYVIDQFKTAMPHSTAYKKYGKDWHSHTYSTAKCAGRAGIAPLYRDPRGPLELVEYPDKGTLFWPSDDAYDFFGAVYLAHAPGALKPPACVKK